MDAIPFRKAAGFIPCFPTVILGLKSAAFGTSLYPAALYIFGIWQYTYLCTHILGIIIELYLGMLLI